METSVNIGNNTKQANRKKITLSHFINKLMPPLNFFVVLVHL